MPTEKPPAARAPAVARTRAELAAALAEIRRAGKTLGLVPTMGALHAGHLSLVDASRRECQATLATIFVNPTQFGPHEDFNRYPRTFEADLALLSERGVDLVFAPEASEMYRDGHATHVEPLGAAELLEGRSRPGHFRGVATIVLKLFNLTRPDRAYFGQKDYQQSLMVRQMVHDLDLPLAVRVCPIVREADGLALSSRNIYLSPDERRQALTLNRSLERAEQMIRGGQRDPATVLPALRAMFAECAAVQLEYLAFAHPQTLVEAARLEPPLVALVAARVGQTRLIDNRLIGQASPPGGSTGD